jgi:type I restriction enzyme, S subunit
MTLTAMPKYDAYKDSGVEWIGDIPSHWKLQRLKYLARLESGETIKPESFVDEGYPVYGGNGFRGFTTKYTNDGFYPLIGRQGALCGNVNYASGKFYASEHAVVVYPLKNMDAYWLGESIKLANFNRLSQSSAQPGISVNIIKNEWFPLPPEEERQSISTFILEANTEVDKAVTIKERQIALLNERKQILIQQAVTQGLDPNVPMKESDVAWIGKIPAHWEVRRSKFVFCQRKERARPDDIQLSATQAYGVIPQEQYEEMIGRKVVKISFHLEKRKHVEIDDFVISMRSFQGGLERAWASGCIRSSYVVLQPVNKGEIDAGFFSYMLKLPKYINALQMTASFIRDGQDLNFDNFAQVDLFIPPIEEQKSIFYEIQSKVDEINKSIVLLMEQITKYKEYKTTLINSAVTGKIKVV